MVPQILLLFSFGIFSSAQTISTNAVNVKFEGHSPHFVIFPQKSSSDFVKVEYKMIKEVTSSGMGLSPPHQVPSLASAHVSYQWNGPTTTVDANNCTVTAVDFSAVLHVNGAGPSKTPTLKIFNKLFKCATAVKNGNETVHVLSDSLKFDVSITDWPFASPSNQLSMEIMVLNNFGKNVSGKVSGGKVTLGKIGNSTAYLDVASTAIADGVNKNVVTTMSGSKLTLLFPSFTKTLVYDPVLGFSFGSSSSSSTPAVVALENVAIALVVVGFGGIVAVFISAIVMYRRGRQGDGVAEIIYDSL